MSNAAFKDYAVADIAHEKRWSLNGGPFGSKLVRKDYVESGVPVIRGTNLSGDSKFNSKGFVYVNEEKADSLLANNAHPGDVIFTQRGTLGQVGIIPNKAKHSRYVISQSQMKLTVNPELAYPLYIYYLFTDKTVSKELENLAFSAGVPHINLTILREFKIKLPSLEIQKAIVDKIGAYDNLIENNNRRIAILEEMAQSLYREWFVKFRFPGHEGCQFKDSALGQIPEGWGVKLLDEVLETIIDYRGKTPKKLGGDWVEVGIKALSALNVKNGGLTRLESCKQVGSDIYEKWMKVKLQNNDILLTSEAPLGEVALLKGKAEYCLSQRLFALRANNEFVSSEYIFLALFSGHLIGQLTSRATGATVAGIRQALLKEVPIVVPPRGIIERFTMIAEPILSQKNILWQKNRNLINQRDMLLPKLISGSINIEYREDQ